MMWWNLRHATIYRVKRHGIALLAALAATLGAACRRPASAPGPNDSGTDRHPRVVTLTPSATEIVAALGAADLLVGVDAYSAYPPQVQSLPKVGDFLSPNLEAILALRCDIAVLDAVQQKFVIPLESAGIKIFAVPMQDVEDVRHAFVTLGAALGRQEAARAEIARLDAALAAGEARARAAAERAGGVRPRVLFVVDRRAGGLAGMVAAGPGTYVDDLLRRAGVANVLADAPVRYVQISAEEVLARGPDIILDAAHTSDAARARDDWKVLASVPAVARGRVHMLSDPLFVTPGPRLDQAFARLVDILWPAR
jgi:cobalamin transport system substrate-binding protein